MAMQSFHLTGGAPIIRAPAHVRLGRHIRRTYRGVASEQSLSARGAQETAGNEAIICSPYWDSGQVLTWGVGHTKAAGEPNPANLWKRTATIADVIKVFRHDVEPYAASVRRAFTRPLSQAQFDAAFDFNFNTGAIEVAAWVKLFNAGREAEAVAAIMNWRKPASIIPRRERMQTLFASGQYSGNGEASMFPANARGLVIWSAGKRINIRPYFADWAA